MNKHTHFDVIIIGGGAAGLMAAAVAGQGGKSVLVLEASDTWAAKVRVSGGGKCNFSNTALSADHYVSQNPHFCKSALARYSADDFKKLLQKYHLEWEVRPNGKMFAFSGPQIAQMLVDEARAAGVVLKLNTPVSTIVKIQNFHVTTPHEMYTADKVIVTTGGLSLPQLGGNDIGHRIAASFGLCVIPPVPALTGFVLTPNPFDGLSGVSIPVCIQCGKKNWNGDLLFTHKGISGPVVFNASLYWELGQKIRLNFLPDMPSDIWMRGKTFAVALGTCLPKKFVACLLGNKDRDIANATKQEKQAVLDRFTAFEITPAAREGYRKAEVTRGGVSTAALNSATLESKDVAGLYFAGEVVDVTGQLGGYNLHWAWASGKAAGTAARDAQ